MKDLDIYLEERLKEYDVLLKERLNEIDVLVKERLNECDIIVQSLVSREYLSVYDYMLLEECLERYTILKTAIVISDIEADTGIERMAKLCRSRLSEGAILYPELAGMSENSFLSVSSTTEPTVGVASLRADVLSGADNQTVYGADVLDFDSSTRFDGVEFSTELRESIKDSADKITRAEDALALDSTLRGSLRLYTVPERGDLSLVSGIESYMLVKLRRVSELDDSNLSSLDESGLSALDYIII